MLCKTATFHCPDTKQSSHDNQFKSPPVKTTPIESNQFEVRVTRSRSRKKKTPREGRNEENAITIDDSSSEDDDDLMDEINDHEKINDDMEFVLTEQIRDRRETDDTNMVDEVGSQF